MLPSLLLATALTAPAAPVPPGSATLPAGLAPVPMYLKADAAGQVYVSGLVAQVVTVNRTVVVNENGKNVAKVEPMQMTQNSSIHTAFDRLSGKFATVGGTELTAAEAARRVRNGAVVFVSADGKPVEKGWVRGLGEETIVVTTDALKNLRQNHGAPNQAGTPAPRLVMLAAGDDGKVRVEVNPNGGNNPNVDPFGNRVFINGGLVQQMPVPAGAAGTAENLKPLDEVKFDAYDLAGKLVPRAEALKRLKNGGLALIAGDHRLPDEAYLGAFRGDLLVLASSDLVLPQAATNVVRPAVAVRAAAVMAAPPVVLPANPPAVVLPAPVAKPLILRPAVKVEVVKPEKP